MQKTINRSEASLIEYIFTEKFTDCMHYSSVIVNKRLVQVSSDSFT